MLAQRAEERRGSSIAQNELPKFFVPHAVERKEAESVRNSTRKLLETDGGYHIATDRRIYSVSYSHDGKKYRNVVGEPSGLTGEEVLVIFDAANVFLSCSANRGVLRGGPVIIGKHWDKREREFTSDAGAAEGNNVRDTSYATEIATAVIGDMRLERIFVKTEQQEEIRLSWWPNGNLAPRPPDIPEADLLALLAEGIKRGVLSPQFLPRLLVAVAE